MALKVEIVAERIRQEIEARALQGFELNGVRDEWQQHQGDYGALLDLHGRLKSLQLRSDWRYREPSDLDSIRKERPKAVPAPHFYLEEAEILQKIHGAWLGRIAGCILGKPFEMSLSREQIRAYLQDANAYPLVDYVPAQSRNDIRLRRDCVASMRGYVRYAQEDDDLNYMCLAVKLLEKQGLRFTTLDVGMNWLESIPFLWTWGPEHVVYLNLAEAIGEHEAENIDLESVTGFLNPGVEWIGAQIRSDVYGYVCPGDPELAAEFAWRDAYLTHRKSGLYGPMWVSAMNASAFTLLDMEQIIRAGLSQVPQHSRFSEGIQQVMDWVRQDQDWWKTGERIHEHFDHYGFAGTINNACCVAAALLYGWGDGSDPPGVIFERAITIAVQLGYDTDCNGATVGSVVGMMLGENHLPHKWVAPMNDTLKTCVVGFGSVSIEAMANRTYQLSRIIRWSHH
jgi:ADP-ribosylglycohydrolase